MWVARSEDFGGCDKAQRDSFSKDLRKGSKLVGRGRCKVGIVCSEAFQSGVGGLGGFGWLTREVARTFIDRPTLGVEPTFLIAGGGYSTPRGLIHGVPAIFQSGTRAQMMRQLLPERFDLLLSVDYRRNYNFALKSLPLSPLALWIQDPRTDEDIDKILTLRIPGGGPFRPRGDNIEDWGVRELPTLLAWRRRFRSRDECAIPAPTLGAKVPDAFSLPRESFPMLPYPVRQPVGHAAPTARPTVTFLGRLDPVKRPWIVMEIARRMPSVDFRILGKPGFTGEGAWMPSSVPDNVQLMGHVDGDEKQELLASSWMLLNTSIHEALPVSFVEALHYGIPVVSSQDTEGVASNFGRYVGRWDGDGLASAGAFETAIQELIDNPIERNDRGFEGQRWARATHTTEAFINAFDDLCHMMGVKRHSRE